MAHFSIKQAFRSDGLANKLHKEPPANHADTTRDARSPDTHGSGAFAGLKRRVAKVTAPDGRTASTTPISLSAGSAGGPARPDVRGRPRQQLPVQATPMSGKKLDAVNHKLEDVRNALYPVAHRTNLMQQVPGAAVAMRDASSCEASIRSMFGPRSGPLAQAVMAAVPVDAQPEYAHEAALTLATALHRVAGGDDRSAQALFDAARSTERPTGPLRRQLAALHRVLAASNSGLDALCHLEGATSPQEKEAFCDAMRLGQLLADRGMDPNGPSLLKDLVAGIDTPQARATWLSSPVGGKDDPPQKLLSQAILHAHGRLRGEASTDPDFKRAYVAWKKGGFVESGAGSDFDRTISRLNKFAVYGKRGDHGPRTAGNLAREAGDVFAKGIGHRKSPVSQMRHGAMGADRLMLDIEGDRFREALDQAITPLLGHLQQQLADPAVQGDVARMTQVVTRLATLEQWQEHGRKNVRVDLPDALARAARIHADAGHPGVPRLDTQSVLRELKVASKLQKGAAPGRSEHGEGMMLHLQVLKDWGAHEGVVAGAGGAGSDGLSAMSDRVRHARSVAKGREETNPLFEWGDVRNMVTGRPARQGPSLQDARRVALQAAQGRYESTTRYADGGGGGINANAVLALKSGKGAAVVPSLRLEAGKTAAVSVGLSLTGGRFFVGTEAPKGIGAGITGAMGVPLPEDAGVAAAFAEASVSHDWSEGEGAVITTRSDVPGWEDKGADVVNFMFDHAEGPEKTPGEFWGDFVARFGDDPHVALSSVSDESHSTSGALGAGATVRANVGHDMSIGPSVSASIRYARGSSERDVAGDGGDVNVKARSSRLTASASASVAQATPAVTPGEGGVSGMLNVLPLMGFGVEKVLSGNGAVFRLGRTQDGRLSPSQCQQELQFRDRNRMIEFANSVAPRWETAMADVSDEHMSAEDLLPRNRLAKFMGQIKNLPDGGNKTYGEFKTLDPATARQIDAYEDRMKTLLASGGPATLHDLSPKLRAELDELQNEISRLMNQDANWNPVALYAFESNAKQNSVGWNWLLKFGGRGEAGATRLLALLVAGKPDLAS